MEQYLTWTKGLFESSYQLFQNGETKGNLLFDTWKNQAKTMFTDHQLTFQTPGFFDSTTQIYNEKAELIGTINFETWQTKAIVHLQNGERFFFHFTTGWYTKWEITDMKRKQISYDSDTSSGRIHTNTDDLAMLISGLYIREYFTRKLLMLILFVIFIPMICRSF